MKVVSKKNNYSSCIYNYYKVKVTTDYIGSELIL